jgi:ectoine hydroxylase-related dioxygenase (phytanoyl-CoA dioxygenase family)
MISQRDVETYRRDGVIVVPEVLDGAMLGRLRQVVAEVVAGAAEISEHNDVYDLEPSHTRENPRVRRIKTPHKVHPIFNEIVRSKPVIDILTQLIGPGLRLHGSKLNMKSAQYGSPVEWHQDWAFYPHTNDDVLATGIYLDDCDIDNGPLMVLPGTHRGPTHDHHADGRFCGAMNPADCDLDFAKAVPLMGPAGSMTIHHVRLVHGSALNHSNRQRRLLLHEYTAADAWPLLGVANFEEFNGRMVLGEPTIEPRVVAAPVRMPLPPADHQGSIYENQRGAGRRFFETYEERVRAG